jgi:hypothetical protein
MNLDIFGSREMSTFFQALINLVKAVLVEGGVGIHPKAPGL